MKAQEQYFRQAADEYAKRLGAEFRIANIEIKEEPLPKEPSAGEIEGALKAEGKRILEKMDGGAFKIALCVEGYRLTSETFASLLYGEKATNAKSADFIIGSSHGLSDEVKKSADFLLSLSEMTFTHSLALVVLSEQLYRAYSIESGKKYHK